MSTKNFYLMYFRIVWFLLIITITIIYSSNHLEFGHYILYRRNLTVKINIVALVVT